MTSEPAATASAKKPFTGVIILALVGLVVVAGVTVWLMSHGGGPVRSQVLGFIHDTADGKLDAAKARCTEEADFDKLARDVEHMKTWGKITSIWSSAVTTRTLPSGKPTADFACRVEYENLSKGFTATLVQQTDGSWRITSYSFE